MLCKAQEPTGFGGATGYREDNLYCIGIQIRNLVEIVSQLRVRQGILSCVYIDIASSIWKEMNTFHLETSLRRIA